MFGAKICPDAKLFDNSSFGRFLILSNLELQLQQTWSNFEDQG